MSNTYRPCVHCKKSCYGNRELTGHWRQEYDQFKGEYLYYHARCHAESQDRVRYPQKAGSYVPYEDPKDKLKWKREKEELLEKHKIEVDSYKKMLDDMKNDRNDDRKEFMDAMLQRMEQLEIDSQNMNSQVARLIKNSEQKVIASLEQTIEDKVDQRMKSLHAEVLSNNKKDDEKRKMAVYRELRTDMMTTVGEMMDKNKQEIVEKMDQIELGRDEKANRDQSNVYEKINSTEDMIIERMKQIESKREEKMEKIRKEVVSSVSSLINMNQEKKGILKAELENIQFVQSTGANEAGEKAVNKKSSVFLPRFP